MKIYLNTLWRGRGDEKHQLVGSSNISQVFHNGVRKKIFLISDTVFLCRPETSKVMSNECRVNSEALLT